MGAAKRGKGEEQCGRALLALYCLQSAARLAIFLAELFAHVVENEVRSGGGDDDAVRTADREEPLRCATPQQPANHVTQKQPAFPAKRSAYTLQPVSHLHGFRRAAHVKLAGEAQATHVEWTSAAGRRHSGRLCHDLHRFVRTGSRALLLVTCAKLVTRSPPVWYN